MTVSGAQGERRLTAGWEGRTADSGQVDLRVQVKSLGFGLQAMGNHCRILQVCESVLEGGSQPIRLSLLTRSWLAAKAGSRPWCLGRQCHKPALKFARALCAEERPWGGVGVGSGALPHYTIGNVAQLCSIGVCIRLGRSYDDIMLLNLPTRP